jgi:hypothetical protein
LSEREIDAARRARQVPAADGLAKDAPQQVARSRPPSAGCMDCSGFCEGCSGGCMNGCRGSCETGCQGCTANCASGCAGGCSGGCHTTCTGYCSGCRGVNL